MKNLITYIFILVFAFLAACQNQKKSDNKSTNESAQVVKMKALDYAFIMPDTISAGWTTFRMQNKGEEHHLFVLIKLPEDIEYSQFVREVIQPYDSILTMSHNGKIDEKKAWKEVEKVLPTWYPSNITQTGGISLTAPDRTSQTTVNLEPGNYAVECYLKTPQDRYHILKGMTHSLTVRKQDRNTTAPEADLDLIVREGKIEVPDTVMAGTHTFAIHFHHDQGKGYDHLSLFQLKNDQTLREVAEWIKYDPVLPAPAKFLGGSQEMPPGNTSYMTVTLEPGKYGWIRGVPPKGSAESFVVR